ncbi:MAG: hypothetical protein RJA61_501 [Candidatus Parcubacteria bacterium]|jgi:DNA polymerase III delta subunit
MLYVFYGEESNKAHDKAQALSQQLLVKKPDASFFNLDNESWTENALKELVESQGLFEKKYIIHIDARSFSKENLEELVGGLPSIQESVHVCVTVLGKLDAKSLKAFSKHAEKIQEFKGVEIEERRDFRMTDALGSRDKKNLWVLYREAMDQGKEVEEIHGLLYWQIKNMIAAQLSKTADEAGLKPYPYTKAKQSSKYYSLLDLHKLSSDMVFLYHRVRQGRGDFEIGLERLILSL